MRETRRGGLEEGLSREGFFQGRVTQEGVIQGGVDFPPMNLITVMDDRIGNMVAMGIPPKLLFFDLARVSPILANSPSAYFIFLVFVYIDEYIDLIKKLPSITLITLNFSRGDSNPAGCLCLFKICFHQLHILLLIFRKHIHIPVSINFN